MAVAFKSIVLLAWPQETYRYAGKENPLFKILYDGFLFGDDENLLDRIPRAETDTSLEFAQHIGITYRVNSGTNGTYLVLGVDAGGLGGPKEGSRFPIFQKKYILS